MWVEDLKNTYFGDANLDLVFDTSDFVSVFLVGKYETEQAATWAEGDWDGDGVFSSGDFVSAFMGGGYEVGTRPGTSAVPEPTGGLLLAMGFGAFLQMRKRF